MKCPNCNRDILDSAIICPFCNTQFAFSAPGTLNKSNYETISSDMNFNPEPLVNDENNMEEFNPSESYNRYASSSSESKADDKEFDPDEEAKKLNFGGYNTVSLNPIQPEPPKNSTIKVEHYEPVSSLNNNQNDTVVNVPQNINNSQVVNNNSNLPPTVDVGKPVDVIPVAKDRIFFMCVIIVGSIVLLIISFMLILGNNRKNIIDTELKSPPSNITNRVNNTTSVSRNIGGRSSFVSPVHIGTTTIASIHNSINNKYYDVDVYGIRFITGIEATQLGESFNQKPSDSFIYEGFEYRVKFNDLNDITTPISPVLDAKIYRLMGTDQFNVDGEPYVVKVQSIYDGGNIMNGNEAVIKVIYSVPTYADNYSVCLGIREHNMGCFTKFLV